jgi:hypothetical protein
MASPAKAVTSSRSRRVAEEAAEKTEKCLCPRCGVDVMEQGWTEFSTVTHSFMRFRGRGAVMIASTQEVARKARCYLCDAALPLSPLELLRLV